MIPTRKSRRGSEGIPEPPRRKPSEKKQVKAAREAVYEQLPEIVKGLALKSGESYLTAKFLFDFAKVEEVGGKTRHSGKPESLAGLLEKLGFADEVETAQQGDISGSEASKDEGHGATGADGTD